MGLGAEKGQYGMAGLQVDRETRGFSPVSRFLTLLAVIATSVLAGIASGFFNMVGSNLYTYWVDECLGGQSLPLCSTFLAAEGLGLENEGQISGDPSRPPGLFPQSSLRRLDAVDFVQRSCIALRIMRNEIYARHGYVFESSRMQSYFERKPWYRPMGGDIDALLSPVERENVFLIYRVEAARRCR